ncbi:MAG: hypothetical protein AAB438_01570 [Patescibacteria group bacterium]
MKNNLKNKSLKIFVVLIIAFVGFSFRSYKVEALSLTPVRFELKGDPGQTIVDEILLTNETTSTETFYSSFANFEAQGESGNPAFVDPKEGLGTWMKTQEVVSLEPGTTKTIPFSIQIPKDAEPGGHFAVIFFGNSPKNDTSTVSIGSQAGILVLLSVNGDVKQAGGITSFSKKENKFFYNTLPISFEYKFKNDGNDRMKPEGKLVLRNMIYYPTEKLDGNPIQGNILPNSTRKFEVTWVNNPRAKDYVEPTNILAKFFDEVVYQWKNFAFGLYGAKLDLSYAGLTFSGGKTLYFFVFPWQLLIVIIIVLFIILFGGGKALKKYNRYIIEKARAGNATPSMPSNNG